MTFIKFCGMTRAEDVAAACGLGVDAVGFVLWPKSPRCVRLGGLAALVETVTASVIPVGVFVAPDEDDVKQAREAGVRIAQVYSTQVYDGGGWDGDFWAACALDSDLDAVPSDVTIVLDAHDPVRHGGTGRTIDWARAAAVAARRRVVLAGGLTPGNVAAAIRQVRPFGVDVSSGIEDRPGIKNVQAMTAFVAAVREAEQ